MGSITMSELRNTILTWLVAHHELFPFLMAMRRKTDEGSPMIQFKLGELLQALIVAGIVGLIVLYGQEQALKEQVSTIAADMAKRDADRLRAEAVMWASIHDNHNKIDADHDLILKREHK
jgi:hypothetical protein